MSELPPMARYTLSIEANTGYSATTEGECTPEQYGTAIAALAAQPGSVKLDEIEQYRMQMAGISTAAFGYWKESDGIHPDYDAVPLRDVAKLYATYNALFRAVRDLPAIRGAVARGWCSPENERKEMDSDLALAIADEVSKLLATPHTEAVRMSEAEIDAITKAQWGEQIGAMYAAYRAYAAMLASAPTPEPMSAPTEAKPAQQDAVDAERWPNKYREQPQRFGPYDEDDDISNLMGDGS